MKFPGEQSLHSRSQTLPHMPLLRTMDFKRMELHRHGVYIDVHRIVFQSAQQLKAYNNSETFGYGVYLLSAPFK